MNDEGASVLVSKQHGMWTAAGLMKFVQKGIQKVMAFYCFIFSFCKYIRYTKEALIAAPHSKIMNAESLVTNQHFTLVMDLA